MNYVRGEPLRLLLVFVLLLVLSATHGAISQTIAQTDLDSFVEEVMLDSSVPGIAVVVFDESGVTHERALGRADLNGTPVTLDTPFQLGSVSKSFAALVILQLHAEGKLDLDAPVTDYLRELEGAHRIEWSRITLRQILSHQSGLAMIDGNRWQTSTDRSDDAMQKTLQRLATFKPSSRPGERFEYSNANYMIIAAVIEKIENRPYEQVLSERIFKPLEMTQSYVQVPSRSVNAEAAGFRQWYGRPIQHRFIAGRVMMAPGGVTASARDLATYVQAVSNRDAVIVPETFSEEILASQTPTNSDGSGYGYGWMLINVEGETAVFHSGLNSGFAAHAALFPSRKTGAVVVSNLSGSQMIDVPGVIARKALGVQTGPLSPTLTQRITLWGLTVGALVLSAGAVNSLRQIFSPAKKRIKWLTLIVPTIILLGLSYGLLVLAPESNGIPLGASRIFQPDIWLGLYMGGIAGIVWALSRTISGLLSRSF